MSASSGPVFAVAGVIVAVGGSRLPGNGRHEPAAGFKATGAHVIVAVVLAYITVLDLMARLDGQKATSGPVRLCVAARYRDSPGERSDGGQ